MAVISVAGVPLEARRVCGQFQGPEAQGPPPPGALAAPWWQVRPPLAPGGLRDTALGRALISQCPGTTGYNENKALPFPRHGNAPQHGEAPAAFGHPRGGFWGPVSPPRRPRIGHEG